MSPQEFVRFSRPFHDAMWLLTPQGKILAANEAAEKLVNKSLVQLQAMTLFELVDDSEEHAKQALRNWSRSRQMIPGTLSLLVKGYSEQYNCNGSLIEPKSGESAAKVFLQIERREKFSESFVALNSKIAQLQTEIYEKRKAEKLFQLVLEASPNGILMMDNVGDIVLVNSKIEEIFGYTRDELINQTLSILVPHAYRDQHPLYREQFFNNPRARAMGIGRDLYGLHKSGREVPLEIGLNPLEINGDMHVLASVVDISERKLADQEKRDLNDRIQLAQRMESLGVLAGGTAHDFNNILYAISGNAELAQMRAAMGESIDSYLSNIVKSCARASDLTKQMLAYAGKDNTVSETVNLNNLVNDMLELMESTIPKDIKINISLKKNLPSIEADSSQMQQIILNLLTNASESMGERSGEITIKTGSQFENSETLPSYRSFEYLQEGEYIFLEVSDTGSGMPQDVVEHMFDPFYTTKFTGRGLGMAAVLGIVRSHYGTVRVESEVGVGTRIKIIFPLTVNTTEVSDLQAGESGLRVLIVDDEPDVRNVLKQMLEVNGFKVTEAKTGHEALKIIDRENANYDLIVLDMNMPGISGIDVYAELKKRNIISKIVFISGYSEEEVSPLFMPENEEDKQYSRNFLQKPFKYIDIKSLLDRLFDR